MGIDLSYVQYLLKLSLCNDFCFLVNANVVKDFFQKLYAINKFFEKRGEVASFTRLHFCVKHHQLVISKTENKSLCFNFFIKSFVCVLFAEHLAVACMW